MNHLYKILLLILCFFASITLLQRYGNQDLLQAFLCFSISVPAVYLMLDRFIQKNKLLAMKEEALRAELALLKSQINPHFFFNTLNNLYGLAVAQSELAPLMILKLSDLMRFTIYQGNKDRVFLRDELAYLENYLEIQKIRIRQGSARISFETDITDDLLEVPPLMFIMLLENAVKHGLGSQTSGAYVAIKLSSGSNWVQFECENNYQGEPSKSKGIGLTNLRRRLSLSFPGHHQFTSENTAGIYKVCLRLEL